MLVESQCSAQTSCRSFSDLETKKCFSGFVEPVELVWTLKAQSAAPQHNHQAGSPHLRHTNVPTAQRTVLPSANGHREKVPQS